MDRGLGARLRFQKPSSKCHWHEVTVGHGGAVLVCNDGSTWLKSALKALLTINRTANISERKTCKELF